VEIKELGHLVLYVKDIKTSASFYENVLGWQRIQLSKSFLNSPVALFSSGRTHHELLLIEVGSGSPVQKGHRLGMYHFGLKVGDSQDELIFAHNDLTENNVRITGYSDHTITHSIYIEDPDGNEIELYIDTGVDWKTNPDLIAAAIKPLTYLP
jgi:catechol 2,3-dioxygenase